MSDEKKGRKATLADEIDATEWDFKPGKDRKILLRPAGTVFGEVPWEVEPQYLGPVPIAEFDTREPGNLTFGPIVEFKGLENRFIALIDLPVPDGTGAATGALYVGLSRARVGLWVAVDEDARPRFEQAMAEHLPAVAAGGQAP